MSMTRTDILKKVLNIAKKRTNTLESYEIKGMDIAINIINGFINKDDLAS